MRRQAILVAVAFMAGTAAFYAGRTNAIGQGTPADGTAHAWLQGAPDEIVQTEQQFEAHARAMADAVIAEQTTLSSMLADLRVPDDRILAQVGRVTEAKAAMMRSVAGHLVQLRAHLPEQEQERLMQSCANSLQGQVQRRYRWRGGSQDAFDSGDSESPGRWGRGGNGFGGGHGRQYRGGRSDGSFGLVRRLQLTGEQTAWAGQHDPNFADECAALRDRLRQTHTELAASFADTQVRDDELLSRIDRLIDAHGSLEQRVARHILVLRPQLSREQLSRLSGLCSGAGACDNCPAFLNVSLADLLVPRLSAAIPTLR